MQKAAIDMTDHFSRTFPDAVYSVEMREKKAKTMLAVLSTFLKADAKTLTVLDLGSSTGIIADYLAGFFGKVFGIDIDREAVAFARKTFRRNSHGFLLADAMDLPFSSNAFDVLICAHIYEHVPDPHRLMDEIRRVLKPGGLCYFAADNRLILREPHYNLPFLSLLPRPISHIYLRLCGKGNRYEERLLTYGRLRKLVNRFFLTDFTEKIIQSPRLFHADYMIPEGTTKAQVARWVVKYAYWLCPGYVWLLRKI